MKKYIYDSARCRQKHRWNNPNAGFQPDSRHGSIGKCSNKITQDIAQSLLENAIPSRLLDVDNNPIAFYATYEGAVYIAYPTEPGKSYHGFPWRGDGNRNEFIPEEIKQQLERHAQEAGYFREFTRWMKNYHPKS